jgi:hypothetical protein
MKLVFVQIISYVFLPTYIRTVIKLKFHVHIRCTGSFYTTLSTSQAEGKKFLNEDNKNGQEFRTKWWN